MPSGQDSHVMAREVSRAMNQLRRDQREVLMLICAGGMSYEEAADLIGCSVGTVKSRLWRARSRMAALVMGGEAKTIAEARNQEPKRVLSPRGRVAIAPAARSGTAH